MKQLKSLNEFEKSTKALSSNELKTINGGAIRYWWEVTTVTVGDRVEMAQEGTWYGSEWVYTSPKYATGRTGTYLNNSFTLNP